MYLYMYIRLYVSEYLLYYSSTYAIITCLFKVRSAHLFIISNAIKLGIQIEIPSSKINRVLGERLREIKQKRNSTLAFSWPCHAVRTCKRYSQVRLAMIIVKVDEISRRYFNL